jgi:hypothetical protein
MTATWLVIASAAGLTLGWRTAKDIRARDRMRPYNWAAVFLVTCASIGTFIYMLGAPKDRCGLASAEILFALTPAAIVAQISGTLLAVVGLRKDRSRRAREGLGVSSRQGSLDDPSESEPDERQR